MNRHDTILRREDALFLIVDFQEKIANAMQHREPIEMEILRLAQGMKILGVPILITEQYRKGLGATTAAIANELQKIEPIEKMTFSCCGNETFWQAIHEKNRRQIIVSGIETHVCVQQTVLDLIANGYQAHIPIAAVGSRCDANRDNALQRMEKAGAILTNSESILFELLIEACGEDFKAVRKLIV
jgi:nicotinamidase-related amidase